MNQLLNYLELFGYYFVDYCGTKVTFNESTQQTSRRTTATTL